MPVVAALDKEDLVSMVMGRTPCYGELFDLMLKHDMATYSDQYGRWKWNKSRLMTMSEDLLWELYTKLKGE